MNSIFSKIKLSLILGILISLFMQISCAQEDSKIKLHDEVNKKKVVDSFQSHFESPDIQINPLPPLELTQYQQCQSDNDCTYINNGCCDCANSGFYEENQSVERGQEVAINANKVEEFKARFTCSGVSCTQRARIPDCGDGVVSCRNNLCSFNLK